jgi:hypothetical protein
MYNRVKEYNLKTKLNAVSIYFSDEINDYLEMEAKRLNIKKVDVIKMAVSLYKEKQSKTKKIKVKN